MEEIIDYIPEYLFGRVIGTGGSMRKHIYNETGGALLTVTQDNVLKLKGSTQQRELAHPLLRGILVSSIYLRKTLLSLKTASSTFQRILNIILSDFLYKFLAIDVDDVISCSNSQDELLKTLQIHF